MALTYLNSAMIEVPATITSLSADSLQAQNLVASNIQANAINSTDVSVVDINFPLSGGNIINNTQFFGNVSVLGSLTTLLTTTTVATIVTTTTALSVNNTGLGPALRINQESSVGPIATFNGLGYEVLRINNLDPDSGQTAVIVNQLGTGNIFVAGNVSRPNAFVVNSGGNLVTTGTLSAKNITGDIITGVGGNSNQWNLGYSRGTVFSEVSSRYESVYNNVKALSTSWEESTDILPTVNGYLSSNSVTLCSIKVNNLTTSLLLTAGNIKTTEFIILSTNPPVQFSNDTGTAGTIKWDSNYLYVCISTNNWKRVALSGW